ncbi:MAG TPA: aminotransferase class V-fold PLP-dependent enzyme, partial [Rhizobiales bacterium]|nr:aminotransferase class V-fold PLP-dependent enzyme [Hyphomicrobiales bacterium]
PTSELLEKIICELEGGAAALTFGAGLSAFATLFETINTGEHIVAPKLMYHGGLTWLRRIAKKRKIELTLFDPGRPETLKQAIQPGRTKIVWIETPTNPTWEVTDIAAAANIAHEAGAILGVDCTCSSPVTTQALSLGADIVFHSATKYLNGHSDVTAGVLITREVNDLWDDIIEARTYSGSIIAPFEAWLLVRGIRTLFIRFETATRNAMIFARHFEGHPKLEAVLYPGLESHPQHDIAKAQMTNGFGGMLSVLIAGDFDTTSKVTKSLNLFLPATSLGGVESLAEHRKIAEGPDSTVAENLIRFSMGIEDINDLIADLEQALTGV